MTADGAGFGLAIQFTALQGLPLWVRVGVLVVAGLVGAKLVDVLTDRVLRRLVASTETEVDELLLEALHLPIVVSVLLGAVVLAVGTLPDAWRAELDPFVGRPTLTALLLVWVWTLNRVGNKLLVRAGDGDSPYASFAPIFSNLLTFALLLGGLFVGLTIWDQDITPLLASAGIVGVAVGFAAKDTVANFFGGLALYFDQTYRVGDYIELDTGETGTVVTVGIRSTTLLTRDEVMVTVPNSVLNNARIINQSAPKRRKRIRVPVHVAYGTDVEALEALLEEVVADNDLVMESPRPRIRFLRFGDSALEYEIRCWVPTPVRETKARHQLNRTLYRRLGEAGIDIPFPQRDVSVSMRAATVPEIGVEPAGAED